MIENLIKCTFSRQQNLETHYHTDYEIIYVLDGKINLEVLQNRYLLDAGDFFLVNTACSHGYKALASPLVGFVRIPFEILHRYFSVTPVLFTCNSRGLSSDAVSEFRKLLSAVFTNSSLKDDQSRLTYDISCLKLIRHLGKNHLAPDSDPVLNLPDAETGRRAFELIRYIDENYDSDLNLKTAAQKFHITPQYLSKFFKDYFGQTYFSYVQKRRLELAVHELVTSARTITSISIRYGFPNVNSFINAFKKTYGLTPAEYRKSHPGPGEISSGEEPAEEAVIEEPSIEINDQIRQRLNLFGNAETENAVTSGRSLAISADSRNFSPETSLKKPWLQLLDIGNSINLIRYDVREQLRFFHDRLGFKYVYINNLLHPGMKVKPEQMTEKYNFSEIKKVLDYIVSLGMHPYIEIESQQDSSFRVSTRNILSAGTRSQLQYLYRNYGLLDAFLGFIVNQYGQEEVSNWIFCLERSTAEDNLVQEEQYYKYFAFIYRVIKKRIPSTKIGGPGFTIDFSERTLERFLSGWKESGCPPDFINLYAFPYVYEPELIRANKNVISRDTDYLHNLLKQVNGAAENAGMGDKKVHVTLWNTTLLSNNVLNDSCAKAAFIMKNMITTRDQCDYIGYWCASDICMLTDEDHNPLFGGGGLLSQDGIRKPAYHAFAFFNALKPFFLAGNENAIVTGDSHNGYSICCHNCKQYNAYFYQKQVDKISIEEEPQLFEDSEPLTVRIELRNVREGEYLIRKRFVNEENGNIQSDWLALGQTAGTRLTETETAYLNARSEPGLLYSRAKTVSGNLTIEAVLLPHEIDLFEIEYINPFY